MFFIQIEVLLTTGVKSATGRQLIINSIDQVIVFKAYLIF